MLMPEIPTVQNFSFQIHARKAIPKMKIKPMTRPKNGGELRIMGSAKTTVPGSSHWLR